MKNKITALTVIAIITVLVVIDYSGLVAADDIQTGGDVLQFVIPGAAAGLTLGHWDGQGALQLGESLALTMAVTYALKYGIDAERPNGGGHSFPSGHTSASFSAAEFLRKRYGWYYGAPAYFAASFVAYSRVQSNQHHLRDVAAVAGIGILCSYIFTRPRKGWRVSLKNNKTGFGVQLSLHP